MVEKGSLIKLYRFGGIAALIIVLIYLIEMVVVITKGIPPKTVDAIFALFQANRYLGLLQLFVLDIIAVFLHAPIFMALCFALRKVDRSLISLLFALIFAFIGMAVYFASNTVFSMLYFSDQFANAVSELQRVQISTSAQSMMSSFIFNSTGTFMAFNLYALAGLLVSLIMLRSAEFSKLTAWSGILGNAIQFAPPLGIGPAVYFKFISPGQIAVGGIFLMVWYVLMFSDFNKIIKLENSLPFNPDNNYQRNKK